DSGHRGLTRRADGRRRASSGRPTQQVSQAAARGTMRIMRSQIIALGLVPFAFQAFAAELDIPGDYGNAGGCHHAKTGDIDGDDLLLLTRREVSTDATLCSFVQVFPAKADSHVIIVTCGHAGEDYTTLGMMRVQKSPDDVDAYLIFDET